MAPFKGTVDQLDPKTIAGDGSVVTDRLPGVDLQHTLALHERGAAGILEGLRLGDALHVGALAVLAGDDNAGRGEQAVGDLDVGDLVLADGLLPPLGEVLELLLELL